MDNNNNINNFQQPAEPQTQPVQQPVYQQAPQPTYQQAPQPVYQQYPQYQQVPGQYAAPVYPVDPVFGTPIPTEEERRKKENNKKGNILCFISLGLMLLPYISTGILGGIVESVGSIADSYESTSIVSTILSTIVGGSYIGSWVCMIIARVKYKNTFSKVLMWIYIGLLIASVIAFVILIAMCAYISRECQGM